MHSISACVVTVFRQSPAEHPAADSLHLEAYPGGARHPVPHPGPGPYGPADGRRTEPNGMAVSVCVVGTFQLADADGMVFCSFSRHRSRSDQFSLFYHSRLLMYRFGAGNFALKT